MEISKVFYEVQAEKFHQKKVEVARGVIELGQILIETKEQLEHGQWIKWLEDSRVNFTPKQANKYMRVARELGNVTHQVIFDDLSLNKLYTLASAPDEVKEGIFLELGYYEKYKDIPALEFIESVDIDIITKHVLYVTKLLPKDKQISFEDLGGNKYAN